MASGANYPRYRDTPPIPASRSNADLQDYYTDQSIPPPHRLSSYGSPFNSSSDAVHNQANPAEFSGPGVYLPVGANPPRTPFNNFTTSAQYTPMPEATSRSSAWLEKQQARGKRSKLMIIVGLILLGLIIIGVAVGVTVGHGQSNQNDTVQPGAASSSIPQVVQSNPSDPSQFTPNPALHNSFYGIAYTPDGSILPECGASQAAVTQDIQLMSQLTTRVRLYGSDCNVSSLVLAAITQTKVNMQVFLGNYIDITNNSVYTRQKQEIEEALTTYGANNVAGIIVGNEVMLNYCTDNNVDPNSAGAQPAATYIIQSMQDTRSSLQAMSLSKTIPVGNSDAGSYFSNQVLAAADFGMANVHPWFATVDVQIAAGWTWDFFEQTDVVAAQAQTNNPTMYIAETGWPTGSNETSASTDGAGGPGAIADTANLQIFLDTFVCQANQNGTEYFFFEFVDEAWKNATFGGVEAYWGLFHADRTLKNLTMPNCSHP